MFVILEQIIEMQVKLSCKTTFNPNNTPPVCIFLAPFLASRKSAEVGLQPNRPPQAFFFFLVFFRAPIY
jgi:hypothetical protein